MSVSWRNARLSVWHLGAALLLGALMIAPLSVAAEDGPQFSNWGPGMPPPDQEGPDTGGTSGASGASGGESSAAPYAAPAPGGLIPIPVSGCAYDLRGTWWNDGRQTTNGFRSYFTSVYVRQYRSWIQAVQDDGTGYYGQCIGSRIRFDVYQGSQYVGRQTGTVRGTTWPYPRPLYPDSSDSYAAPAVPAPPIGGGNLTASFTWTAWFGSGYENWSQSSGYYPGPGPLGIPTPVSPATATPVPTPAPTSTPVPAPSAVHIDALSPPSGPAGADVIIVGNGFASDDNMITFGPSLAMHHPDGTPANVVAHAASADGRTLEFNVPQTGPSGVLCDDSGSCIGVSAALLQPGGYNVTVINSSGTSNAVPFQLTGE